MTYLLYILLFQNHASNFRNHCEFKMKNARITKYFKSEGKKKNNFRDHCEFEMKNARIINYFTSKRGLKKKWWTISIIQAKSCTTCEL